MRFRSKERGTRVKDRAKNGASKRAGSFLAIASFLARPNPKIPFLGLSLLRNGNACYAGYWSLNDQFTTFNEKSWDSFDLYNQDWKWPQCEGDDLFPVDQGDLDSSAATTSQNETVTSPDHTQPQYLNPTPSKPIIKFCKELPPETPHIEQEWDMRSTLLTLTEEKSGEQASRPSAQEPEFLDAVDVQSAGTLPLLQSVEYKMCSSLHLNLRLPSTKHTLF